MEDKKLYIKLIQKEMNDTLESGILKPEQEQQFINQICMKLILANDPDINKTIKTYFDDLDKIDDSFKKTYKKYADNRYEMVKEMCEEIKKL